MQKNNPTDARKILKLKRENLIASLVEQFNGQYKTEKDCQQRINQMLYPGGDFKCRECGSKNVDVEYGSREIECLCCKKKTSVTAYTFFHRIRSARSYLIPIWIMEQGVILNASEIANVSDVVNSTGQHILKKITFVVQSKMSDLKTYINSEQMRAVISKRSRETRKRQPPDSEIIDSKYSAPKTSKQTSLKAKKPQVTMNKIVVKPENLDSDLDKIDCAIMQELSSEPAHLEVLQKKTKVSPERLLASLTILELDGYIDRLPGDFYLLNESVKSPKQELNGGVFGTFPKSKLKKTVKLIKEIFHGISRKYLQLYMAAIWIYVENSKWGEGKLLEACCRSKDSSPFSILNYVSPYSVQAVIVR